MVALIETVASSSQGATYYAKDYPAYGEVPDGSEKCLGWRIGNGEIHHVLAAT